MPKSNRGYQWLGWMVAGSFYLYDVFLRLTCDVITSKLQADFNLNADQVSASFSSSFFYGYAAMQLPVGYLIDTIGPRYTIIIASLLSGFGCVLFSFAESVYIGILARVLSGIGCGCGWLGAVKVTRNSFGIDDSVKVRQIFAVTCMLGGLGGLISQAPFQYLVSMFGWRGAYKVASIFSVFISVGSFFFVGDVEYVESKNASTDTTINIEDSLSFNQHPNPSVTPLLEERVEDITSDASNAAVLLRCFKTPRLWLYAIYLGGSDAPFETFAGLWGCTFFVQVYGWTKQKAATATTICVILSTVSQLGVPAAQSKFKSLKGRLNILTILALLGALSIFPFVIGGFITSAVPDPVAYISVITLGLSVASCTVIWSIISSDKLCNGTASTGIISGAVNSLCIAFDAMIQQLTGLVLSSLWSGQKNKYDEPVYDAHTFSCAFMVLMGCFLLAVLCSLVASCKKNK
jgi:MFS family permease